MNASSFINSGHYDEMLYVSRKNYFASMNYIIKLGRDK